MKKNSSNREIENRAKNTFKNTKMKNITQLKKIGDLLTQTHCCFNANQESTRCGNHLNIIPLFGGLDGSFTFSPLLSYSMKHTHTSQKATMATGWERDG
jgi:hypothetical protein